MSSEEVKESKPDSTLLAKEDAEYIAIATKSLDGTTPQAYSINAPCSPFSFVDPTKRTVNNEMPPPIFLTTEELVYYLHFTKDDMMPGYTASG